MSIPYALKRSTRARTMRLTVYPDARVVLTAPTFFDGNAIERFIAKHSEWIAKHVARAKKHSVIRIRRCDIGTLKKRALALASARCAHFVARYGLRYRKIAIRAQKSRWGSCSHRGNLSFNYRIAALPKSIADYIVVHELCHLAEPNHSKKFWDLVAKSVPDHANLRRQLRKIAIVYD